jgi:GntR family transcriptional regulator / MocR family aminotransferase
MTKAATSFDLPLGDARPGSKVWRWLYEEIRDAILSGRLKRGSRLPATRELARQHAVSRGTVVMAFEQLHAEGYLEGRTGGWHVCQREPARGVPDRAADRDRPRTNLTNQTRALPTCEQITKSAGHVDG